MSSGKGILFGGNTGEAGREGVVYVKRGVGRVGPVSVNSLETLINPCLFNVHHKIGSLTRSRCIDKSTSLNILLVSG